MLPVLTCFLYESFFQSQGESLEKEMLENISTSESQFNFSARSPTPCWVFFPALLLVARASAIRHQQTHLPILQARLSSTTYINLGFPPLHT
jgi:hypothetical protein